MHCFFTGKKLKSFYNNIAVWTFFSQHKRIYRDKKMKIFKNGLLGNGIR
jgi:hypothetical protein